MSLMMINTDETVAYACGSLISEFGTEPVDNAVLVVNRGKVQAVLPKESTSLPENVKMIDLDDLTIMPGLIDCHVHLIGSEEPGAFYAAGKQTPEFLLLRAAANASRALAVGITTLRDCGGKGIVTQSLSEAISQGWVVGPRVVNSGAPMTTTGGHCYYIGIEAEGAEGVQRAVRNLHKTGVKFIKVMVTGGGLTVGSNSHRSQYSLAELRAIVDDAHRLGKAVAGHVHGTEGIVLAVDAGFDTLEHCSWLSFDSDEKDYRPDVVEKILKKEIFVCRSIAGFERTTLENANSDHSYWQAYEVFRKMVKAGVKLIAGTDSGIDYTPVDGFITTLETMVGLGEMPVVDVLKSATTVAAEALGLSAEIGDLKPGKWADFIAVKGDPRVDIRALRQIPVVACKGQIVARDGVVFHSFSADNQTL